MNLTSKTILSGILATAALTATPAYAQSDRAYERMNANAENRPLQSLAAAAERARNRPVNPGPPREVQNYRGKGIPAPNDTNAPDSQLQNVAGVAAASVANGFPGSGNLDGNGETVGFLIAPPDTDGHIGGTNGQYYVQMINVVTTIFDNNGNTLSGPFPSNAFWSGIGGNCEAYNQGDPIVLYDEVANRWMVSQFAFPDSQRSFSQCVAISQTDNPLGGYNRYEFSFDNIGFNDYPKHGIVSDSVTLMANLFIKRGRGFTYGGTYLAAMNKAAMYAGDSAEMRGFNIGGNEFGFVAGDLDGPGTSPALFATAMTSNGLFDIWQLDPNWSGSSASVNRITRISIPAYDGSLCGASRGACIPQPNGGPAVESLSDRLMHRLQVRDFGDYRTMLASHTVDVGAGRAGIRWYEFRDGGSNNWSLYQSGTYAPDDGQYRWMPSMAMNGRGDIGLGYMIGSSNKFMSIALTGQTAAASGSGVMDAAEMSCVDGGGVQEGVSRSGDYSSTSVDPSDDLTFWHTNQYVNQGGNFVWDTYVCNFEIGDSGPVNQAPTANIAATICSGLSCPFDGSGSSDSDGSIVSYAWDFGDGNTSTAEAPTHTYGADGTYAVSLTVTDDGGKTNTATTSVTVDDGVNSAPNAVITFINCPSLSCDFSAAGSSDSDGSIVDYDWDFGDGSVGSGVTTSHTYSAEGDVTVTLTVTDDGSATDSAQATANPTEPVAATTMSVGSVVLSTTGGRNKSPRATVTIIDDQGAVVGSANVTGAFTGDGGGTASGTTNSSGSVTLTSSGSARGKVSFTFCVTGVSKSGLNWDGNQACASN